MHNNHINIQIHFLHNTYLHDSKIDIVYTGLGTKKISKLTKVPLHVITSYKLPRCQFFHNLSSFQFFKNIAVH